MERMSESEQPPEDLVAYALRRTYVVRPPRQHLATFGTTSIKYYLVTEPTYTALDVEGSRDDVVIREGTVRAEQPQVVTPHYLLRHEGFGDHAVEYLQHLAERHAYVFYITPGPARLTNTAYWGPPIRVGQPQKALSVNMGPHTNVESVDFQHNALAATSVSGRVQDRITNLVLPIQSLLSLRPPLAAFPDLQVHRQQVRRRLLRKAALTTTQALARAQAQTDRSTDEVVTATGELDAMRYGELLQPRALVGLRGAGHLYDGFYYVKRVTHSLSRGSYKQSFTLAREGLGTTTSVVRP